MKASLFAVTLLISLGFFGWCLVEFNSFLMKGIVSEDGSDDFRNMVRGWWNRKTLGEGYKSKLLEADREIHQGLRRKFKTVYSSSNSGSSSFAASKLANLEEGKPWFITEPIVKVLSEGKLERKCQELSNKNYKWMADHYDQLKSKPLNRIKIPGTHDSFTDSINFHNNNSALMFANDSPSELWKVFTVPFMPKIFMFMMMAPWGNTQSCSVMEQLNHGLRYFDIRVCKDDRESLLENQFKVCHNFFAGKVMNILSSVKDFVINVAPSEFIILDLNHFYGMTQSEHNFLLNQIVKELDGVMIKSTDFKIDSTLERMWANTSRRVFVFYDNNLLSNASPELQPYFHSNMDIRYTWADTLDVNYLNEYNIKKLKERSQRLEEMRTTLFNLQIVLTPDIMTVIHGIFSRPYSILDIAEPLMKLIPQWIEQSYDQSVMNIVTADYYHLFNFTDVIIQSNFN